MPVSVNEPVPDFALPATGDQTISLASLRGKAVVIYFYPKDSTPGCTTEAGDFRDLHAAFAAAGCVVLGVSRDSLASHAKFSERLELPFPLLSDQEELACQLFDVIKQKKMYGKDVRGIERSTFLIDREGVLRQAWRGVKVAGHAQSVLDCVRAL